jgi:hypothetical protein
MSKRQRDEAAALSDMTNLGIEVQAVGKTWRIRARSLGYMELILGEMATILESTKDANRGLKLSELAGLSMDEVGILIRQVSVATTHSLSRIVQMIVQKSDIPPGFDGGPDEWDLSLEDIKWRMSGDEIGQILGAFLRVQYGWLAQVKNWVSRVRQQGLMGPGKAEKS